MMAFIEFVVCSQLVISVFFGLVHTQTPDVGRIFIGFYDPTTGRPIANDYSFSLSNISGKTLPVYALVFSGNNPNQTVTKKENISITCDVSATTSSGFSGVRIDPVTLNADVNTTNIPLILSNPGRPVTVTCSAQSQSATCPATVGGAQFCPGTSVSNSVSITIRSNASVSICEPQVIIKNNGLNSDCGFSVRLSETANSNVTVSCTQTGALSLTINPLEIPAGGVDGQVACIVPNGAAGSNTSITCQAQSQTDSQFNPAIQVPTSTALFVMGTNTINFHPAWSEVYNTTFTSLFYLSGTLESGSVSVACQATQAISLLEAENSARQPDCSFTTSSPTTTASTTTAITIATTTATTTVPTTTVTTTASNDTTENVTLGTTSAAPVTPRPTTPPDPTSDWIVVNSLFTITSSSIFQTVTTQRLRKVIDVRTEIIVTTCCVLPSSTNTNYRDQRAVAVAVAHLAPFECSQCSNASITNPKDERVLQNPGYVEVAPCACDLTQNGCDINCCCDPDCSRNERLRFNGCIPGLPGGQSPEPQDYKCSSTAFNQPDWQTLTCVYWENNWYLGLFYKNRQKLRTIDEMSSVVYSSYKGKFSLSESENRFTDKDSGQQNYTYGVIVGTLREDIATNSPNHTGTLSLSQPGPGATCNPLAPVQFLVDQASACRTIVTSDLCSSLSVLSARIYVMASTVQGCSQSYKVRLNRSKDVVTPTDVRYYCANDSTPFLPSTAPSLESLNPNVVSNLSSVLASANCCDGCSDPVCWQYNRGRSTQTVAALPPACSWDDPFTSPQVPVLDGAVCSNVVVEVSYNFEWQGTEITKLTANIILANISSMTNGAEIVQKFSVSWRGKPNASLPLSDNYADTTDTYKRSGSAGYDMGKPLLSGRNQYNVTTGQFGPVDVISEKQMAIWRPGANGLCDDALRQPLTFGDDVLSGCALRLTFSVLNNTCDGLRQLASNHLNVLLSADVIGRYGYNDVNNQSMWIPVLRQQLNLSSTENTTSPANSSNTTQEMQSLANSIAGICLLPSAANLHVLYAQTRAVNGQASYEVLGAFINYTWTNWTMDCVGANKLRCDASQSSPYAQNFILTSSVTFTKVPARPTESSTRRFDTRCDPDNFGTDSCYRYFNDFVREECYYDTCWQELAYPLLSIYPGDAKLYSLPFFLVLVLGVIGYVSVARPGWN